MFVAKVVIIGVVVLLVSVLAYAATRPDEFRVQRSITINAPAEKIFPHIGDFHAWAGWSPYEKLDPGMRKTFSGASTGVGSVYEWSGNSKAGSGRMEITSATAPGRVTVKLDFLEPFEGHNTAEFTLQPRGDATEVTWAMHGPTAFVGKVMGIFVSMDKFLGKDFEAGLAGLKALTEKQGARAGDDATGA